MLRLEDLASDQLLVIEALVDSVVAWESPSRLSVAFGLDIDLVEDALAELEVAGWVQPWEEASGWLEPWNPAAGVCVTFTPRAVEVLGIRIVEEGPDEVPRWARPGEDDPPLPKSFQVFQRYESLAIVPDRDLGPLDRLIFDEGVVAAIARGMPVPASAEHRKRDARQAALRSIRARERRKERIRRLRLLKRIDNVEFTPVFGGR